MKKFSLRNITGYKIAYLVQSYEMKCLICGKKMLKNGFKAIKIKTFSINKILTFLVIKKQKYLCKPSANCPQTITKIAEELKEFNRNIGLRIQPIKVL